ncbi:MAG: hypothetical protein II966_08325 [Lachnospiraceae bacterium]|nr:hypothetical protein [Lachnospiraceae bacterium]
MAEINGRIDDNELDQVTGGAIFNSSGIIGADPNRNWEVLDDRGNVMERFNNRNDAEKFARDRGVGTWEANWDMVTKMRSGN